MLPWAAQAETCRYRGTAEHGVVIAVTSSSVMVDGVMTLDLTLDLRTHYWVYDVRYLLEEISTWRGRAVQSVAINGRTIVNGTPRRQQWDVFLRTDEGLEARRVQAKTLDSFRVRHPGFVAHWEEAAFGKPWLSDYDAAPPDRRPDLDLAARDLPPGLVPSFALAFYWSRWLPPGGAEIPVFLPGFKHDARTSVAFGAATGDGPRAWVASLRHPRLSERTPSTATVTVASGGDLEALAFDLHAPIGSARGAITRKGCEGAPVPPP